MNALTQLIQVDKSSDTPVYLQICNSFIQNIRKGHIRSGARIPSSRELAALLNVHRKTAIAAYEELMAQNWIHMIPRKGTYVTERIPDIKPIRLKKEEALPSYPTKTAYPLEFNPLLDLPLLEPPGPTTLVLNDGFPDLRLAPTALLYRELRSLGNKPSFRKYFQYGNPKGSAILCETLAAFLNETRGLPITSENVMITQGAQMGIFLSGMLLLKPGDEVIVGEPGYFSATYCLQQLGASVNRVPVDDFGIDTDVVERLCRKKKIRAMYVVPHHHHPTTVTLAPERRIKLLQLARQFKFALIEDDYDYDFHYNSNPILPLASLDQSGNVIYVGTLTKTLAPAIRVGFLVAPKNFIQAVANLRRIIDRQGDTMMEAAIAALYQDGTIARHIKKSVKLYRERRDHFCALLKDQLGEKVSFRIPDGGMSVWTTFHTRKISVISGLAREKGLVMSDGRFYNPPGFDYNACRMGFASLNFDEQERAVDILAGIL